MLLGLELSEVEDSSQRVVLYYTDDRHNSTQEAASFKLGELTRRWARFTLTVQGSEVAAVLHALTTATRLVQQRSCGCNVVCSRRSQVRLYMDCEEHHRVAFNRSETPLTFDDSSGIFVGNAGGSGLPRFVVSQQQPLCVSFVIVHIRHRLGIKTSILTSAAGTTWFLLAALL